MLGTLCKNTKSSSTHSRLYLSLFLVFLVRKTSEIHPWNSNAILAPLHAPCNIISIKTMHLVVGHTLNYTVSKFGVNWTNHSSYWCFWTPPVAVAVHTPLHLLHLIHHLWSTKHQCMYHSLHVTGLPATRCESFTYSSASLRLGPKFARSRLRKNSIIYSASWTKRAMLPWADGYQQMKHTRMALWSS